VINYNLIKYFWTHDNRHYNNWRKSHVYKTVLKLFPNNIRNYWNFKIIIVVIIKILVNKNPHKIAPITQTQTQQNTIINKQYNFSNQVLYSASISNQILTISMIIIS
jgi:hypothetical protein